MPSGLRIEQVNRESIKWKKNGISHFCEAAWYTVMAAIRHHQPRIRDRRDDCNPLDRIPGSSLRGIFGGDLYDDLSFEGLFTGWPSDSYC